MRHITTGKEIMVQGVKRVGKPIPISIGRTISEMREETIKAKKHDVDVDHIQNVIEDFTRWYAPNGYLPSGNLRPASYQLLHNKLGLAPGGMVGRGGTGTVLMKRLITLVERVHNEGIHELDCYKSMFNGLKGIKVYKNNNDSEYWRKALYKLWNEKEKLFNAKINDKTVNKVKTIANIITGDGKLQGNEFGDDLDARFQAELDHEVRFSGYRFWAAEFANIADEDEQNEKYAKLFDRIDEGIEEWLDRMAQEDEERRDVYTKLLAIYIGSTSFGVGIRREDGTSYSLPGYAFWTMPKEVLVWIASKVHPDNPYIEKYSK
jgi:hypothetical protein